MTIQELARRGTSGREIARTLEVTEGTVRYHLRRKAEGAVDGRSKQKPVAIPEMLEIGDTGQGKTQQVDRIRERTGLGEGARPPAPGSPTPTRSLTTRGS